MNRPTTKCSRLRWVSLLLMTLVVLICLLSRDALAQSATATLSGDVVDQNGAVVVGAEVKIVNPATSFSRQTITNDSGGYTFPLLPPGTYTVTVQRDGFSPIRAENVVLNVGDQKALEIQLKAGDVNASVQVTTDAPLISESPAVATVVDRQFVENIPLNGRSFQSLITLTPGVVVAPTSSTTNAAGQFSVNGQRASANSFMVDGVSANFGAAPGNFGQPQSSGNLPALTTFGTTQSLVSVDALQEFKIQTSTYSAEYGRQPGGQISIATRSGTNQYHGSLFDYLRNDVFDANDWFASALRSQKPKEKQNDFGGTFSGPVVLPRFGEGGRQPGYNGRNRTFFFFSYEGLRLRQPQFNLTNVPTLVLRQQARPGIQPILNAFPLPNGKDLSNGLAEFTGSYSDPSSLDATSIRFDHAFSSKHTLFGRYNKSPSESINRRADIALNNLQSRRLSTQSITIGVTESLTPAISNELRLNYSDNGAYTDFTLDNFGGASVPPRSALIPTQYDSGLGIQGAVQFNNSGRTSASAPGISLTSTFISSQRQWNVVDNFSYTVGPHQLKFGVDYRRLTPNITFNLYALSAVFASQQELRNATSSNGVVAASIPTTPIFTNFSAYGQDTWKASRRLAIDVGLRWDVNPAPSEAHGHDQAALTEINDLATMQLAPLGTKAWKTTYNNFAPRVGVAYQVSQASRREMLVRGGFGVFYDAGNDLSAANFNGRLPNGSIRLTGVSYPLSASAVAPLPLAIQTGLVPPYGSILGFDPALKLPYTLQWNLAVEQSLGKSQALTMSYVGASGKRLLQSTQLSLSKINPAFTSVQLTTNAATSNYNGLQVQFQRRLSRGLQALVSYTWSHALDDDSSSNSNRVAQYGDAAFDVRHLLATAATYEIPVPGAQRLARTVLAGWSLDSRLQTQSSLPVDLVAAQLTDPTTGALVNVRPNVIAGIPLYLYGPQYPAGRTINNTVPTAAQIAGAGCSPTGPAKGPFCTPPSGQSGTLGRNQVRALAAWQLDAALHRQFGITEKVNLQFRAEAFNLFNHPNFGTIQTTLTAPNFGQATNMLNRQLGGISQLYQLGGPRSFQFALKLQF